MADIKERARTTLRNRINNLIDYSQVNEMIEETIDELWDLFEDDVALSTYNSRHNIDQTLNSVNADQTLNCKGVEDNNGKR